MFRATFAGILCVATAGVCVGGDPRARFEVASVKLVEDTDPRLAQVMDRGRSSGPMARGVPLRGHRVEMRSYTLEQMIATAYLVRPRQVVGPAWLSDKRFNVDALIPEDAPVRQANEMLRALIEERFGLRAHRASREEAGYFLTVAKGGPHLKASGPAPTAAAPPSPDELLAKSMAERKPLPPGASQHSYKRITMERFAEALSGILQSPVEDRTGLDGMYDIVIDIPPPVDPEDRDPRPAIVDGVKKLGLNLQAGRIAVPIVVIDRLERMPTGN